MGSGPRSPLSWPGACPPSPESSARLAVSATGVWLPCLDHGVAPRRELPGGLGEAFSERLNAAITPRVLSRLISYFSIKRTKSPSWKAARHPLWGRGWDRKPGSAGQGQMELARESSRSDVCVPSAATCLGARDRSADGGRTASGDGIVSTSNAKSPPPPCSPASKSTLGRFSGP